MFVVGALKQKVIDCHFRVTTCWAAWAVDQLESVQILVEGNVADTKLENAAGWLHGYSFTTDILQVVLRGGSQRVFEE